MINSMSVRSSSAVFTVDGRGTPGRSKAFLDAGYGPSGECRGLADHVAVLHPPPLGLLRKAPDGRNTTPGIPGQRS